ncbi:ABC transporter ATP-binding protein [Streptomyces europaeiscabiei]|uniref:ABC transporter ATP-binding protein n=1 Tax=Streptomyces europaeiscabiei TaxID=146819 RepID=UPI0029A02C27|nr:ABC transporter ATP-binding protein [Streptomyces europaeiscabiei]MDX3711100.1 ABC transporter ATP-binding protein [Streptomyces europaeiscabiei]
MPEVTVKNLAKTFGDNSVLRDVTFTIKDGEFFTLLGASGCGKSTTLNCIAGLEQPTEGSIAVGGRPFVDAGAGIFLPPEERNLGMVFQSYALWPHMTIAKNLALPLTIRKVPKDRQRTLIHEALDKVGLAALSGRYPHQLSGGQQQRVALARALVYSPSVLLLDEPLSNLDAKLREQARAWLKRLQEELGITTVYVTHDQDEALALSDRIAVMEGGNMIQIGTPHEIYERPAAPAVAAFVGRCNFLTGKVVSLDGTRHTVLLDAGGKVVRVDSDRRVPTGDSVTVAVRPERLEVVSSAETPAGVNRLDTQVITSSYVGSRYEYDVRLGDQVVQVLSSNGGLAGEVALVFDPGHALLYADKVELPEDQRDLLTVTA